MVSAYLYGLYVYLVELSSACDVATVDKYLLIKFNTYK